MTLNFVAMKRSLIVAGWVMVALAILMLVFPFQIRRVCFGDVCPQNGGVFLLYALPLTHGQCVKFGGHPVEGIGWSYVYAGCSPLDHSLSN
jgi:hypothetical protein